MLVVQVPPTPGAWERVKATVVLRNQAAQPILPVLVRLSSARAALEEWGIEGKVMRWAQPVRGRKTADGWDVLLGPELGAPQLTGAESSLQVQADQDLLRIDPLLPGAADEFHVYFDAAYDLGDRLDALLVYLPLDVEDRPTCVVIEKPDRLGFVACRPVSRLGPGEKGDLYLPAGELGRGRRTVNASAHFATRHPDFDIEPARRRAGIAEGPYGYDTQSRRWILVDPTRSRTSLVGAGGDIEVLPGDWLTVLIALNSDPEIQVSWTTGSDEEARRVRARLDDAAIMVHPRSNKGTTSPTTLRVSVDRSNLSALAQQLRETGHRLEGNRIVRRESDA